MSRNELSVIKAQNDKKFIDLSHSERTQIFNRVCLSVGIREAVEDELKDIITVDIKNKYPSLKAGELEIAMNMNKYGEFENKDRYKIQHFQILSPDYVCEVLSEYYKHRQKLLAKITKVDPYQPLTDEQKQSNLNYMLTDLLQKFEQFKAQGDIEIQINKPVFDYLWENRLLHFSKIKVAEYKKRATEQHIKNLTESPIALKSPSAQKELKHLAAGISCPESDGSIAWLSRMIAINDWFKQLISEKKELKDLLS